MFTHYVGDQEARAYLRELADRLLDLGDDRPTIWCGIGPSGEKLVEELLAADKRFDADTRIILMSVDRTTGALDFKNGDPAVDFRDRHVLLLDSSIHSGSTMLRAVREVEKHAARSVTTREVEKHAARSVTTYTLVLKRSSSFVPTLWALTIGDHDRAYFWLDSLPNNRLESKAAPCHLRKLTQDDLELPTPQSGRPCFDRVTWSDRWFDMRCSDKERRTYLLESGGAVVGYLTYSLTTSSNGGVALVIDEVVVDQSATGAGHGSTLLRWAETMARQSRCDEIQLWGIDDAVPIYKKHGYKDLPGEPMNLEGHTYTPMVKKVIYHIDRPYRRGGISAQV